MATIKITQLPSIGNNLSASTVLPVVDISGTATTDKTTVGNIANFILSQAGNTLPPAFVSTVAYSVANAAQPNITSVGVLTGLEVSGDVTLATNLTSYANANLYIASDAGNIVWNFGKGGALVWPGAGDHAIEQNIDDEFEIHSHNNVVISTDVANSNNHFTFATDGVIYAPSNVVLSGSTLFVGPGANTLSLVNPTIIVTNTAADYVQAAIINTDSGSADWIAYGNTGSDAGGWGDIGFTSTGFSDPNYTITGPGDGYFFTQGYVGNISGGNLVIATGSQGTTKDIIFATGGFLIQNEFARISDANNALELNSAGSITGANKVTAKYVQTVATTFSLLGSPVTAGPGARAFITNANLVAAGNFGAIVSGSGSNAVPVYSDGTNWRLG